MFYRIKPVFVFDGSPPQLKRDTLSRRRIKRSKEGRVARAAQEKILTNYLQRQAVAQKLNRETHAVENALKQGAQVCGNIFEKLLYLTRVVDTFYWTGTAQVDQK